MQILTVILAATNATHAERGYMSISAVRLPSFLFRALVAEVAPLVGYSPGPGGSLSLGRMMFHDAGDGT